jgi:predicted nuclease of predicted toxin-antitoxin system
MPDPMKLYLDQCLRLEVAWALRHEGYDVMRASEVGQARADDSEILLRIQSERRVLITLDDHFGNWAVLPLRKHPG